MITEFTENTDHCFRRIDFTFAGHTGVVIFPETAREDRAWVWRAEFLGAFDTVDVELLRRGWHLLYYSVSDMFGNPASVRLMEGFYRFVTEEFSLSDRCDIFGFSRGGLYAFNFTCANPDRVSTLYLDAPVLDMRDWPCAERYTGSRDYTLCPERYGMTREELFDSRVHPVDRMEELYIAGVPVVLVAGAVDTVVLYPENGARLHAFLVAREVDHLAIVKPDCDHHPHSVDDPTQIADFIENHRK